MGKQYDRDRKGWLVGGGIGSLAAAAFMIRDGKMAGADIAILESEPLMGGSLDVPATRSTGTRCAAVAC